MSPQEDPEGKWALRQTVTHERWDTARPKLIEAVLSAANVQKTCGHCSEEAVIRCLDCFPRHLFCEKCDVSQHRQHALHNRDYLVEGFHQPISPTVIVQKRSNVATARLLPLALPTAVCSCSRASVKVRPGRPVTLVTMNGMCLCNKV
ncbi:hypothetical protein PO909_002139 [Leuciscus waleckii]